VPGTIQTDFSPLSIWSKLAPDARMNNRACSTGTTLSFSP
jgi:hypothetical protein